jgi:hypothetical protein
LMNSCHKWIAIRISNSFKISQVANQIMYVLPLYRSRFIFSKFNACFFKFSLIKQETLSEFTNELQTRVMFNKRHHGLDMCGDLFQGDIFFTVLVPISKYLISLNPF